MCQGSAGSLSSAQEVEFVPFPPTRSSQPGRSLPAFIVHSRIALFRNTRVCLQASGMLTFTPSMRQLPTTIYCVCRTLCAGQGTLCALFKRMQKPGFLHFTESQCRTQRVKGLAQSHTAGELRGPQAPGVPICTANPESLLSPHGLALLAHPASRTFTTFQALLSKSLHAP